MPSSATLQLVADAERTLRRGNLKEALLLFQQLSLQLPHDASIVSRIQAIESVLQPNETSSPSFEPSALFDHSLTRHPTDEQTAEMLFDRGDLSAAISTYSRIVQSRQNHELAQERLDELKKIHSPDALSPPPSQKPTSTREFLEMLLIRIASRRRL